MNINGWTNNNKDLRIKILNYSESDIISLNETKLSDEDTICLDDYYYFDNKRKSVHVDAPTASGGVGLLVKYAMAQNYNFHVVDKSYNDILAMKFIHKYTNFTFVVVSAYLPPETSPWGRDAFSFYNHLLQLLYNFCDVDGFFILGDLNSRIGDLLDYDQAIDDIGTRSKNIDSKINGHGRSFIEFLLDAKCGILNGRISPCSSNKYTYQSVRGLSTVDYIVVPHDNIKLCSNMNVQSCTEIVDNLKLEQLVTPNSRIPDHSLITVSICMNFRCLEGLDQSDDDNNNNDNNTVPYRKNRYNVRTIPSNFLQSDHVQLALQSIINNIECNRESQAELDAIYEELIALVIEEMNSHLLIPRSKHTSKRYKVRKPYWNESLTEAWKAMHESESLFNTCHGSRRQRMKAKSVFVNDTFHFDKLLKYYKRLYDRGCLLNIEHLQTANPTEFWNHVSRLGPRVKHTIPMETVGENGEIIRNKKDVINKWVHDYKTLYLNENDCYDDDFLVQCTQNLNVKECNITDPLYISNAELNKNIELGEIMAVLKNAKNNKSTGIDQIPYEVWKCPVLLQTVRDLFQYCLDIGKIPNAWTQAIIAPIPKSNKNDKRLPLSYRGISLLSCIYKLYSSFLNSRLQKYIENNNILSDEQNGFRESRSCEDHIYVMDTIINTRLSQNQQLFACFIDFSKAFDLINRDQLMLQILNKKIDGNFYWSLKSLYAHTTSCIKINGELTDFFNITNGVRQGDPLSPTLFSLFIDDLLCELKALNLGINIEGLILTILAYADDLVILTDTEDKMQKLLDTLTLWCSRWRLSINNTKSGVVHFRRSRVKQTQYKFKLANKQVEVLSEYKYLGVVLDEHLTYKPATKLLANAGGRALGGIISKFRSFKDIGYDTYTKLFDNCVIPILEYGAGVWAPGNKYPDIDNIMYRACRYYLGVHRFAPIAGIMGDMGWTPNSVRRQVVACRLWNRLVKMDESRLTKHIFNYDITVNGKFSKYIADICNNFNFDEQYTQRVMLDLKSVRSKAMNDYINEWRDEISNKPKLRTYKLFKQSYGVDPYVKSFLAKRRRSLVAQTRFSILPLRLETGRFVGESVEDRVCQICHSGEVEDELHFLFHCEKYSGIRGKLLHKIENNEYINGNDIQKLNYLFKNHPYILGNYIDKIVQERKDQLYKENC